MVVKVTLEMQIVGVGEDVYKVLQISIGSKEFNPWALSLSKGTIRLDWTLLRFERAVVVIVPISKNEKD